MTNHELRLHEKQRNLERNAHRRLKKLITMAVLDYVFPEPTARRPDWLDNANSPSDTFRLQCR